MSDAAPSLFDPQPAQDARDEALERVGDNAQPDWLFLAEMVVRAVPVGETLTTDEIWEVFGRCDVTTHEPRALGAVMMRLARAGVIAKTGDYRPSTRRECHARPIPVWRRVGA